MSLDMSVSRMWIVENKDGKNLYSPLLEIFYQNEIHAKENDETRTPIARRKHRLPEGNLGYY